MSKLLRGLITVLTLIIIWLIPTPQGLEAEAWQLLAIFIATIVGLILQPLPMGAIVLIAVTFTALSGTLSLDDALAGFANSVVWLIVMAFLFARGFIKTGLGQRIAYLMIKRFGKSSLGLSYAIVGSDLILAPATPSNTARAGGVLFPIVRSLCNSYDSEPGPTAGKLGSYLMVTVFQANLVTSAMFMTAMAANPLVVELSAEHLGVQLDWATWALAASVPGIISLILIPILFYKIYPPEIKQTPEAAEFADNELKKLGPMTFNEKVMLGVFVLALVLWATGQLHDIGGTTVALLGVGLLLIAGVLEWKDVLNENGAWNALIWFGGLVAMASGLGELGFIDWFTEQVQAGVADMGWFTAYIIIALVYFYAHYGFASMTAHVTAMFVPFATVAIAAGAPAYMVALTLGFFSNLNAAMTHYGTGPAPIYFGAGYVELGKWWKLGFLTSVIFVVIWLGLGSVWWNIIGLI
ncbi:anion permease [Natranaerofaba carboxydovora]|uniref:anion permease n=1 Tax=Natranaerofaba carboxydovora TaxID=2742683 RepID=UPI001F147572|nr:anion permease [Natranaerofaba carboxydovora]UMZ73841.1 Putative malate transporter YflS [Natranaerofaba carboxydovora]